MNICLHSLNSNPKTGVAQKQVFHFFWWLTLKQDSAKINQIITL